MRIVNIAERGDILFLVNKGGIRIWTQIKNVAYDGSVYSIGRDGSEAITEHYFWSENERCFYAKLENVTT